MQYVESLVGLDLPLELELLTTDLRTPGVAPSSRPRQPIAHLLASRDKI